MGFSFWVVVIFFVFLEENLFAQSSSHSAAKPPPSASTTIHTEYIRQCGTKGTIDAVNQTLFLQDTQQGISQETRIVRELFSQRQGQTCTSCHSPEATSISAKKAIPNILDFESLEAQGFLDLEKPENSILYQKLQSGEMPPKGPAFTSNELQAVADWMKKRKSTGVTLPKGVPPFISNQDKLSCLVQDLRQIPEKERPFIRYFSLVHLHNAALFDRLKLSQEALSKLINHLSRKPQIMRPLAIDPAATLFRIDLRNYQWSIVVWQKLVSNHPYIETFLSKNSPEFQFYQKVGIGQELLLRGDWFTFVSSKPPFYHEILQLPGTVQELQKNLQVNLALNYSQKLAVRAGFQNSGVSLHNRVIERHPLPGAFQGSYWRSYDFGSSIDEGKKKKRIFSHPMDFEEDGGEVIYNLPNGLQSYFLFDAKGKRLDRGPLNIVRDVKVRRDGNEVINGISCMGCHYAGIIRKADEVREYVASYPILFSSLVRKQVDALYGKQQDLLPQYERGEKIFAEALKKTGSSIKTEEPISNSYLQFENSLSLRLAAAEFGMSEAEFSEKLRSDMRLAILGFSSEGKGQVLREVFNQHFKIVARKVFEDGN